MKKSEIILIGLALLIAATTTLPGAFLLAGVLIGGAFTSAAQRALREGEDHTSTQLSEWNARCDKKETK